MPIRVKQHLGAYRQIRSAPALVAILEGMGQDVAARANAQLKDGHTGFRTSSRQGARRPQGRWRVSVAAVTRYAKRADAAHNILLRTLNG